MARRTLEDMNEEEKADWLQEVFTTFPDEVDQKIVEMLERIDRKNGESER